MRVMKVKVKRNHPLSQRQRKAVKKVQGYRLKRKRLLWSIYIVVLSYLFNRAFLTPYSLLCTEYDMLDRAQFIQCLCEVTYSTEPSWLHTACFVLNMICLTEHNSSMFVNILVWPKKACLSCQTPVKKPAKVPVKTTKPVKSSSETAATDKGNTLLILDDCMSS